MANPEHLEILVRGVYNWNAWRRQNASIRPDLCEADLYVDYLNSVYKLIRSRRLSYFDSDLDNVDLNAIEEEADRELEEAEELLAPDESGFPRRGADLSGVDLCGADLRQSDLTRADLSEANLSKADLSRAKLYEADLRGASLSGADLSWAKLRGADLRGADLSGAKLYEAGLSEANLSRADLSGASLYDVDLRRANVSGAHLGGTCLDWADLRGANLSEADLLDAKLRTANLSGADLSGTNLVGADLRGASLVEADLTDADLTSCRIYGISAWRLKLSEGTKQQGLVITPEGEPDVTADDIEVAQFLDLMLHNDKLQRVIDTITTKVVLILGRFSLPERKNVLDALRDALRKRNYVPVVFDFEKPRSQTTINTVMLLARMARFVIADISDAKSVLQELQAIVPSSPKLPVQPIIVAAQEEPGMFDSFEAYPWLLTVHRYDAPAQLLADLDERVIGPAEAKVAQLRA
jgi:uncharacterized protein YjbI with pentapeptide repeats